MKIKIWIAYSLLLSFFVLVTPRTFWHTCEHSIHSHSSTSKDPHSLNHIEKKSCFACDFDLGFVDQPSSILVFKFQRNYCFETSHISYIVNAESINLFSDRGPPII